jgi:hypothetical protein
MLIQVRTHKTLISLHARALALGVVYLVIELKNRENGRIKSADKDIIFSIYLSMEGIFVIVL